MHSLRRLVPLAFLAGAACSTTAPAPAARFLAGTATDPLIVTTVLSLSNSLLQVQSGAPTIRQTFGLGSSTQITPVGFSLRSNLVAIPTGNAASVIAANLDTGANAVFTWPSGNATGSVWLDDNTIITTNPNRNLVGRVRLSQVTAAIADTIRVAAFPTDVVIASGRLFIVSSNLDANFSPAGPGVVTEIDPVLFTPLRTFTVGRNPGYAAGFNNKLYVTNAGDFGSNNGTVSVIDLASNTVSPPITGFGDFPGPITIDAQGRAYISGFGFGTVVYNTVTNSFLRGAGNPLCAPVSGVCRGATGAQLASNGKIYQAYFGSSSENQAGKIFVYDGTTFALTDSITTAVGASAVDVRSYR